VNILKSFTIFVLAFCLSCTDESTSAQISDVGNDTIIDLFDASKMDTALKVDMKTSSFPDPNRENKAPCEKNIDCARGTICNSSFQLCAMTLACAEFGGPKPDEVRGCLIGRDGQSRFTEKECDEDADCPNEFPTCIFKACQEFTRCQTKEDCKPTEVCENDTWCQEP